MIEALVQVAIVAMMFDVGLRLRWADLYGALTRWPMLLLGLVLNVVLVPALTFLVLSGMSSVIAISTPVFAAIVLASVAPGAPLAPKMVQVADGDLPHATLLMLACQAVSIVTAPLTAALMLPAGDAAGGAIARTILVLMALLLVPMSIGSLLRARCPRQAAFLAGRAQASALVLFLAVFGILVTTRGEIFASITFAEYALIVLVVALYALPAWCVPGITPALRTSFAFTAAARNFALAMVLAAQGFGGPGALAGILVFAVLSTALGFFAASYVGRTRRV